MVLVFLFIFSIWLCSCGNKTEETDAGVIAVVSQVSDAYISSQSPDLYNFDIADSTISIDETGARQEKLLLYIPDFINLYDESVLVTNIAEIRLELFIFDIGVNPENILIYPMAVDWTPFVTWNSRYALNDGYDWTTPGGDLLAIDPATPDIERDATGFKKMSFDLTQMTLDSRLQELEIKGFVLQLRYDPNNDTQSIVVRTTNGPDETDPRAVLIFSNDDEVFE
ncbi:MAG: hypothetical protein HRU19_02420 [Pseudobacteriovorax sp.]|nr:hypothetical protein [Pseudobacteriovorax sp.]